MFGGNSYVLFKEKKLRENHYKAVVISQNMPNVDTTHVIIQPKVISKIDPVYPPEAIKNEIEGKVTINIYVTKEGNVSKATVKFSSGSAILDSAAIDYSYNLKFSPAQYDSLPKSTWISMIYKYFFVK